MKHLKLYLTVVVVMLTAHSSTGAADNSSQSDEQALTEQLQGLDLENKAPEGVSRESLYVVQDRYLPLKNRSEITVGAGINLTGDSYLKTTQVELGYRFHLNNRWSIGANYAFVGNSFTDTANELIANEGIAPDVAFAKSRMDLLLNFNAFYGKFRLTMDRVLYFDQYVAIGPGLMEMNSGNTPAGVADVGFVFWVEKLGSVRVGLKDYIYQEKRLKGESITQNLHAHLDIGYVF
ncbi:MAG: outer membrane beta-barrel domain-containing protein [Oligoflexia bacterium]|nr:outer membrane beta-barrel domain-containing protein [Oligoflexia bacterium]